MQVGEEKRNLDAERRARNGLRYSERQGRGLIEWMKVIRWRKKAS
jgi:hypothetical protein